MDGENLTTSLLHWGAYSFIRRPWSSNLETFLHLLCISDKRNHRWLFLLLVLYCLLSVQFSSGTQSFLTLCKTHGLQATECQASMFITNSQSLLKLMSIKSVMPSNHLTLCHLLLLLPSIFLSSLVFSNDSFTTGGQRIGASASVLPVNIQDWFPLGLTCWISLQSRGLTRVFSNITVQKHLFFGTLFIVKLSHP